jgi:chemotaxis protein CheX
LDDVLKLPEKLDVAAARSVRDTLLSRRGTPVVIDAAAVGRASALAVEVLLSGARQWCEDGQIFRVEDMSDAFLDTCHGLGIAPLALCAGPGGAR